MTLIRDGGPVRMIGHHLSGSPGRLLAATAAGYLIGSLPSADLASWAATHGSVDLRNAGSGNPGAVNAMAELGVGWGVGVLMLDIAKGAAGSLAGRRLAGGAGGYLAATASIAGHIAPLWSHFRGGKGVATSAGACLALFPAYFPMDITVAILSAKRSRDAERAIRMSCALWVTASLLWWWKRLPNGWGPAPTAGLPAFAAASSTMIVIKFARARDGAAVGR